jgi:hypothetical protein
MIKALGWDDGTGIIDADADADDDGGAGETDNRNSNSNNNSNNSDASVGDSDEKGGTAVFGPNGPAIGSTEGSVGSVGRPDTATTTTTTTATTTVGDWKPLSGEQAALMFEVARRSEKQANAVCACV